MKKLKLFLNSGGLFIIFYIVIVGWAIMITCEVIK